MDRNRVERAMAFDFPRRRAPLAGAAALALIGVLSAPATAETLASPPIGKEGGSLVECAIANVSGSAATVTLRIVDNDKVISSRGPLRLPAGASMSADAFCSSACAKPRCEFATSAP